MRTGALRQPPPLPEAARTGWSRLEPAVPAREPAPHKGRRRLTARVSLRRAGAGCAPCCALPPSLCLQPAAAAVQVSGPAPAPSPPRGPCSPLEGSGHGAELGRGEPKNTRPFAPHTSHLARFSAQPQWPCGNLVYGKPLALLLPISPASLGLHDLAAPGNEILLRVFGTRCLVSFPFGWEIPGGALKAKLLKLYRKDGLWVW
ncbi:hypothetical protein VULLAG_LOCUS13634 [Vulpes lagopus]